MKNLALRMALCGFALSLIACGDVLSGTWVTTALPTGLSAEFPGTAYKSTLLLSGKNATSTTSFTQPANAGATANCVTTKTYSGTLATSNAGFTITFTFSSGTVAVTGCTNAAGNSASAVASSTDLSIAGQAVSGTYVVTGDKLTITGSVNSVPIDNVYTKQK